MKFIFAGTTEFGIPSLEKLMKDHELLFVVTQPDKPVGRKQELSPPPIKIWAQKNNVRILQPTKISEIIDEIALPKPDFLLVAAYGQIIPLDVLNAPKFGSINIHGSLLPKYRGASPIQAAISAGESKTGLTFIKMDEKMDHGPVIGMKEIEIDPDDTFEMVYKKLSTVAADVISDLLTRYVSGTLQPVDQDHSKATFTKLVTKADTRIDWTNPARRIYNLIRAYNPEPGVWTTLDGKNFKIIQASILNESKIELPGKLYSTIHGLAVKAADQSLLLIKVQPEGSKIMSAKDFQNGLKNLETKHFV